MTTDSHVHAWQLGYRDGHTFENKESIELNCYGYDFDKEETCYATRELPITGPPGDDVRWCGCGDSLESDEEKRWGLCTTDAMQLADELNPPGGDSALRVAAEKAFALLGLGPVAQASKNAPVEAYRVLEWGLSTRPARRCDQSTCSGSGEKCAAHSKIVLNEGMPAGNYFQKQVWGKFQSAGGQDA